MFRAPTCSQLVSALRHWDAETDSLPATYDALRASIEEFMCDYMPKGICQKLGRFPRLNLKQVVDFSGFLGRQALARASGEAVFVDEEEANRRAAICQTCPNNASSFCSSCLGLSGWMRKFLLPGTRTDFDSTIGACSVCGCMLPMKVHFSIDVLRSGMENKQINYPSHCWMNND